MIFAWTYTEVTDTIFIVLLHITTLTLLFTHDQRTFVHMSLH